MLASIPEEILNHILSYTVSSFNNIVRVSSQFNVLAHKLNFSLALTNAYQKTYPSYWTTDVIRSVNKISSLDTLFIPNISIDEYRIYRYNIQKVVDAGKAMEYSPSYYYYSSKLTKIITRHCIESKQYSFADRCITSFCRDPYILIPYLLSLLILLLYLHVIVIPDYMKPISKMAIEEYISNSKTSCRIMLPIHKLIERNFTVLEQTINKSLGFETDLSPEYWTLRGEILEFVNKNSDCCDDEIKLETFTGVPKIKSETDPLKIETTIGIFPNCIVTHTYRYFQDTECVITILINRSFPSFIIQVMSIYFMTLLSIFLFRQNLKINI